MNWVEYAAAIPVLAALSGAGKFYADNTYVLVADSLKGQLYAKEEEIFRLEQKDVLTEDEQEFLDFLKLQKKRIELELE